MLHNSTFTMKSIDNEIYRYITFPAQACAYKYGHIHIKEMRTKAETELGERFNLRDFHGECLRHGQIPLPVLDDIILQFIKRNSNILNGH